MGRMVPITVKVPEEVREEMRRLRINWSERIREFIVQELQREKARRAAARLLRLRSKKKPVPTQDVLRWIREGRKELHRRALSPH